MLLHFVKLEKSEIRFTVPRHSAFSRVLYLSAMGVQLMNGFFLISVGDKLKGVEKNSSSLQHLFLSNHILSL